MINKNKKGFTIVELVIVIAVIAVLAAVLIPTFASIIARANESADIQAVRQMNMALMAESVENPPEGIQDVINILAAAGYNSQEKLIPVSSKHGFYWCEPANMITLIKDEGDNTPELIFPVEDAAIDAAFEAAVTANTDFTNKDATKSNGFYDLEPSYKDSQIPSNEIEGDPLLFVLQQEEYAAGIYTSTNGTSVTVSTDGGIVTITLGGACTIDEAIIVSESENVTIDLNGNTLMVNDPSTAEAADYPITVLGTLNIVDNSAEKTGTISINEENGKHPNADWHCGICVGDPNAYPPIGTLNLNGVRVTCNRNYNIENYGTASLTNTNFTVNSNYGFYNAGTAFLTNTNFTVNSGYGFYDAGTAEIKGGSFVANGAGVTPVYCDGGDLTITKTTTGTGTKFYEGTDSVSYNNAPIEVYDGTATLSDVTVEVKNITTYNSIFVSGSAVTVNSGDFTGRVGIPSSGSVLFLNGGTFTAEAGWIDFTRGKYSYGGGEEKDIVLQSTDKAAIDAHVTAINQIINPGDFETENPDTKSNDNYSIIATTTTTEDENGNATQKTTYAITNPKTYVSYGDALFGDNSAIDENEVVTMYLNTQGFYVDANIEVNGTLNVAYGDIRVGESNQGKIIVNSGATLNILGGVEFYDSKADSDFKNFVLNAVTLNGGTFEYNNQTVTIDGDSDTVILTPIT